MGSIRARKLKDGTVALYARYVEVDGRRTTKPTGARTPEAAEKWLLRAEARVAAGLPGDVRPRLRVRPERETITLRQLVERFCGTKDDYKSGAGADTVNPNDYRRQAWSSFRLHIIPTLGHRRVAEIHRVDVVKLRDSLKSTGRTNTQISRALRLLSRAFSWAIEMELAQDNPVRSVKKPRCEGSTKFYSEAEVVLLLDWAAKHDAALHPIIAFAFYTGCRKGEIAALRWSDIDWPGSRIVVTRSWKRQARKSGRSVAISMHPHLVAILKAHAERSGGRGEDLVFPKAGGGMRPKHNCGQSGRNLWGLDAAIKAVNDEAGAEVVRRFRYPWHSFRHTHATTLAMGGASALAVRDALGQSTLQMASNYVHLATAHVAQHVARLPTLGPVSGPKAPAD